MSGATASEIGPFSRDLRARLGAYLGILCAYLAAVNRDPLLPQLLVLFGGAAAWSLAFEHRFPRPFFPAPVKIGLIALGAVAFIVMIARGRGGGTEAFANAISRFLFWNAVVFVLSRNKSEYDFWTIGIIELSLFMISGSFVQPARFLPLLVACAGCFLYTFHRIALLKCGRIPELPRGGPILVALSLLFILEAGALAFVAFPRGLFRAERADGRGAPKPPPPEGPAVADGPTQVGMPRSAAFLRLENFQKLKTDPAPVLRIRVRDLDGRPVPADRTQFLRGAVLDAYEGGGWRTSFRRLGRSDAEDGTVDGWTTVEPSPPPGRQIVRALVRTSALSEDLAFALPDPVRVQWPLARHDPAGVLFYNEVPRGMVEYTIESALQPAEIPARIPREAPGPYLQVPPGLPVLRDLSRRLLANVGEGRHARVSRFVHYLTHNGFGYRLDPFVAPAGKDPVEHFLETKTGYCVQYATALALLCRVSGIPARVATGFQLHDPLEDGSFIVRSSDAHAWVEVWYGAQAGWRAYDATPESAADAPPLPEGAPVATSDQARKPGDEQGPSRRWDAFMAEFDPETQDRAFGASLRAVAGLLARFFRGLTSPLVALGLVLLAGGAVLAWTLMPHRRRNRLRQLLGGFRETTTIDYYRDLLWVLSKRGLRRHPSLTPWEFSRLIRLQVADEGVDFIIDRFYRERFGGEAPSPEDRVRIDSILERLRKANPGPAPSRS